MTDPQKPEDRAARAPRDPSGPTGADPAERTRPGSDLAHPDLAHPDLAHPDLAHPDLAHPDLAHPGRPGPEADRGMPTAGRRPPPPAPGRPAGTSGGESSPGERTKVIRPVGAAGDPDEVTTRLTVPGAAGEPTVESPGSVGDEPTVESPGSAGEEPTAERPRRVAGPGSATSGPGETGPGGAAGRVTAREAADGPGAVVAPPGRVPDEDAGEAAVSAAASRGGAPWRRLSSAGALIWVLLALFGFTLVVQLRSNDGDQGLATARQEDLVRILSDLEARDSRLQTEITALESSQRQLTSGVTARQAALDEATKRADELGLLAGTLPGRGPGLKIVVDRVKASAILNAVQELRGAGGEVMEIAGTDGDTVRIVASSYFVDAEGGGIIVDGARLTGPYTVWVIGSPQTMQTALQIPGGVVASVNSGGGSVTMEAQDMIEVSAVRKATALQYAHPVS